MIKFLARILAVILTCGSMYLVLWFITQESDPVKWHIAARIFYGAWSLFSLYRCYTYEFKEDNES